jgi:hypothetical protein
VGGFLAGRSRGGARTHQRGPERVGGAPPKFGECEIRRSSANFKFRSSEFEKSPKFGGLVFPKFGNTENPRLQLSAFARIMVVAWIANRLESPHITPFPHPDSNRQARQIPCALGSSRNEVLKTAALLVLSRAPFADSLTTQSAGELRELTKQSLARSCFHRGGMSVMPYAARSGSTPSHRAV